MSTSHFKLSIPKPCTEDWNAMSPSEAGRFCSSCKKHVIDFTVLSDTEIQNYFIKNSTQPVCGHFRKIQLERIRIQLPSYFFQKKIPVWQKYLIVFLICFGSNLYSVDISVGNHQALNAQSIQGDSSTLADNKPLKKKKFKIRKLKNIWISDIKTDLPELKTETLGFIVINPIQPIKYAPSLLDTSATKKDSSNTGEIASSALNTDNTPLPQDDKKPKQHWEFILPAPFILKRRKRN